MVEKVIELCAKLHIRTVVTHKPGNPGLLAEGHIGIEIAGISIHATPYIALLSQRGSREIRGRKEPVQILLLGRALRWILEKRRIRVIVVVAVSIVIATGIPDDGPGCITNRDERQRAIHTKGTALLVDSHV